MAHRSGTELVNPFKLLERVGIRQGFRVADLGCGSLGHFVFPAAQLVGTEGIVYAVDIQRHVLERIESYAKQEHFFNVVTVWSDVDVFGATRIENGTLDLVLHVNNLFLSQNRESLIREMARLTKPGGRVIVVEWKAIDTPIGPPTANRLDAQEAKQIMKSPFLKLVEEFEPGPYHYGLIYQRTQELV